MFFDKYDQEVDNDINKRIISLNQQVAYLDKSNLNYTFGNVLNTFCKVDRLKRNLRLNGFK